jgi:hypothetical protein
MPDDDVIVYDETGLFATLLGVVSGIFGALGVAVAAVCAVLLQLHLVDGATGDMRIFATMLCAIGDVIVLGILSWALRTIR